MLHLLKEHTYRTVNGFSEDYADNLIGMRRAIKTGFMNYQKRDDTTTTPTTAEDFVREVYYQPT